MTANFFQNLKSRKIEYLLISGQATVLYGAATFSEDIDLWINPTRANCEAFLDLLRFCGGRYYKLTPPFTFANLERGHGFHFVLPDESGQEVFLDIMGAPPRVGAFEIAVRSAVWMDTQWGGIHTIGLKDLVEIKKTQRLEDYPIISKLALAWFEHRDCQKTPDDFRWALGNIFTLTELRTLFEEHPKAILAVPEGDSAADLRMYSQLVGLDQSVSEKVYENLTISMQRRMGLLQQADRVYWRGIIAELKDFRNKGTLMEESSRV